MRRSKHVVRNMDLDIFFPFAFDAAHLIYQMYQCEYLSNFEEKTLINVL